MAYVLHLNNVFLKRHMPLVILNLIIIVGEEENVYSEISSKWFRYIPSLPLHRHPWHKALILKARSVGPAALAGPWELAGNSEPEVPPQNRDCGWKRVSVFQRGKHCSRTPCKQWEPCPCRSSVSSHLHPLRSNSYQEKSFLWEHSCFSESKEWGEIPSFQSKFNQEAIDHYCYK